MRGTPTRTGRRRHYPSPPRAEYFYFKNIEH
jgi:hypothetical protein